MMPDLFDTASQVWKMLPLPPGQYRYIMLKPPSGKIVGSWVRDANELAKVASAADGYHNVYIQLNPANSPSLRRASLKNIDWLQAVMVDLDPVPACRLPAPVAAAYILRKHLIKHYDIKQEQVAIIDSGRGSQLWILMNPVPFFTEVLPFERVVQTRRLKAFITQVADLWQDITEPDFDYGMTVDPACSDLPRVARMPGTTNLKSGSVASVMASASPGGSEWFFNIDPAPEPERPSDKPVAAWQYLIPRLTAKATEFILFGVQSPGRHAACFAAAKSLRESGATLAQARDLLHLGAERCSIGVQPYPLDSITTARILRQVYEKE